MRSKQYWYDHKCPVFPSLSLPQNVLSVGNLIQLLSSQVRKGMYVSEVALALS